MWLEDHVTQLAEWCCEQVREQVKEPGHQEAWVASFNGYYQTRGYHSNNTVNIAWLTHSTNRGVGHNCEGTYSGAEADMYKKIFLAVIAEIVTNKDSSISSIYCQYFPEGNITYCSNHSVKPFVNIW